MHPFADSPLCPYLCIMKDISIEHVRKTLSSGDASRKEVSLEGFHRAGVLVPLVTKNGGIELLLTKRTENVETHKGQISFPGGMVDASDADIVRTALREMEEELGIPQSSVEVMGLLDDLPTPTRFVVTPVIGVLKSLPVLTPNVLEVDDVFFVPLAFFADPTVGRKEYRRFRGENHEVWYYHHGDRVIWGVTALIIRSLLKKLGLLL